MVVLFSSCGFFSSRKRELVKEQIPSDRTTKKSCAIARPTSSERFVSSAIAFGTISELERTLKFLLFIIARRRERAKRAFFLYLPREIARRNRNEEKRSVRAQNDLKRNARRRRTQTSLSLSLGFRSFAVSFVVKGHSRRERIIFAVLVSFKEGKDMRFN